MLWVSDDTLPFGFPPCMNQNPKKPNKKSKIADSWLVSLTKSLTHLALVLLSDENSDGKAFCLCHHGRGGGVDE